MSDQALELKLRDTIPQIPDFPKEGILFYDITAVMRNAEVFQEVIKNLDLRYKEMDFDAVVGIDARGFIFGSALAYALEKPFIPVRKPGKLPPEVERVEYMLEYGSDSLEIRRDSVKSGLKTVVVDDLLATGGTAKGTIDLIQKVGAEVVECCFIIELSFLNGRDKLSPIPVNSLITYDS